MKNLLKLLVTSCILSVTSCVEQHLITLPSYKEPCTFEVGNKEFLLDSNHFTIKAAELHYSRIPKEYWDHRVKMCKALGMNTICVYVFWNYHEPMEGVFDFTGNKDIAEFCRTVQKNDMYVILRPGPYVCSEWDMGGLPWWLLKKDNIKLRTLDPNFINPVKRYMKEVGNQLADLQITRGGNIILVQVENEYGSYATDKPYVSKIRDIIKESGFDEVPLFQCDWMSNFMNNGLDDLLWTINYGTGCDIQGQFYKLKSVRPNTPLMCSEFWSGWFDHWGLPHETRPADVMVSGVKEMLDNNISFSLYMTHGGTTFGYYAGANDNPYSPICTSYDYDAPISENGSATPKFYLLRDLMKRYGEVGEIPEPKKLIDIPEFELNQYSSIMDNLPIPEYTDKIQSMEKFNQGYGSIMYRTIVNGFYPKGSEVKINQLHDYGLIFINGNKVAELDRRTGKSSFILDRDLSKNDTLDIYVEALGRINFGKNIKDCKGITESVIISGENITGWYNYLFPIDDYNFVSNMDFHYDMRYFGYPEDKVDDKPCYYKGEFSLSEIGDTYLDFSRFGKGFVWINGIPLGRIWSIGPQQTLYVPSSFLRDKNTIVVLDILGTNTPIVSGQKKPLIGNGRKDLCRVIDFSDKVADEKILLKNSITNHTVKFIKILEGRYLSFISETGISDIGFTLITDKFVIDSEDLPLIYSDPTTVVYDLGEIVKLKSILFLKSGNKNSIKLNMYIKATVY